MFLILLSSWGKPKDEVYFVTHEKYLKFKFHCAWIQFYWNMAMPIQLCIAFGCFCALTAKLSSCNRNHGRPAKPKIFMTWPSMEKVCHPLVHVH